MTFQNENLCAEVDGKVIATVPDLICLVDVETFTLSRQTPCGMENG